MSYSASPESAALLSSANQKYNFEPVAGSAAENLKSGRLVWRHRKVSTISPVDSLHTHTCE